MNLMFLTKEDQARYDKYTKEQVYESYLIEVDARKRLAKEVNALYKQLAAIRFTVNQASK